LIIKKGSEEKEEIILMNPSKSFKEIYKEKIENEVKEEVESMNNTSSFKSLVMYLGSQFFIKKPQSK
jgi:hypothetical protein